MPRKHDKQDLNFFTLAPYGMFDYYGFDELFFKSKKYSWHFDLSAYLNNAITFGRVKKNTKNIY
jgi:hypothetical protein